MASKGSTWEHKTSDPKNQLTPTDTHLVTWYFTPDQVWRSHQGETKVIKMHAAQYTAPQHSTLWHNILLPSSSKWHRCVMLSFHSDHCSHKTIQTWYPACMQTTETPPHCVVLYQHHLGSWMTTEIFRRHWQWPCLGKLMASSLCS